MSARNPPRPGWVTVAAAAAALTEDGDTIDASNVSRYLARNPGVPSMKDGKFRWVDLAALKAHRQSSVYVADKRDARELEAARAPLAPAPRLDLDDDQVAPPSSALSETKLALHQLDLRRKQREEAVEEGRLVPVDELQTVVSAMLGAFTAELARQETNLTAKFGAAVGVAVRQAHREARAKAAARLKAAAEEVLNPAAAASVSAPADDADQAAA